MPNPLLGVANIADLAKVTKQAVSNWRARHPTTFRARSKTSKVVQFGNARRSKAWVKNFKGEDTGRP